MNGRSRHPEGGQEVEGNKSMLYYSGYLHHQDLFLILTGSPASDLPNVPPPQRGTVGGAKQCQGWVLKAGIDGGRVDKRTAPMY